MASPLLREHVMTWKFPHLLPYVEVTHLKAPTSSVQLLLPSLILLTPFLPLLKYLPQLLPALLLSFLVPHQALHLLQPQSLLLLLLLL